MRDSVRCRADIPDFPIETSKGVNVFPPRPLTRPVMFQRWDSLTFLHWRYAAHVVREFLPTGLEPDIFDNSAWVGMTPFRIMSLRPPGLPSLPWISNFPETNVRTYVRGRTGERAIWFFTLEAARVAAVLGARTMYGLPYRWARMRVLPSGDTVEYRSRRYLSRPEAFSHAIIQIGQAIPATELEVFLTARFRLYSTLRSQLIFADVEHEPWPLRDARILRLDQNLLDTAGLPKPAGDPIVHYSPGVHVRIGRPEVERPINDLERA